MRTIGKVALTWSAFFLVVVAILINSAALFYMSTAMIAMIGASRLQAWMSVQSLRFERRVPPAARVGEDVTVDLVIWSETKLKRPLVSVVDGMPSRLVGDQFVVSSPVAPSFDQPIFAKYSFKPQRRGHYRWSRLTVWGTDALGLVTMSKSYATEPVEFTIYPAPISVSLGVSLSTGWGTSELETGKFRGSGIEARGVREYAEGDPLRHVHWASSARAGQMMVKEFESGAGLTTHFVIQDTVRSEFGEGETTSLEAMCGHACYLSDQMLKKGARVFFPTIEPVELASWSPEARRREIDELLADILADKRETISERLSGMRSSIGEGATLYLLLARKDHDLPDALHQFAGTQVICLIYDPLDYPPIEPDSTRESAADIDYLAQLRSAGAHVVIMPKVGGTA